MLTADEMRGVVAMMPAFTTAGGDSPDAVDTVHVAELERAVDRIIKDGINAIATTGSFGEFHTLLWEEQQKLAEATVAAAKGRVPVFIGCTSLNTRETLRRMKAAAQAGADGVLVGVPFYFPSTLDNAVRFFLDIAEAFPKLAIMIYHNPPLHHITIPPDAFRRLVGKPNIVAMKDSHRDPMGFMRLQEIVEGKISVFVNQIQLYPYVMLGAAGCWSIHAWLGPAPLIRARDAALAGNWEELKSICVGMASVMGPGGPPSPQALQWRESTLKLAVNEAGYCHAGPLRPPFRNVPEAVRQRAKEIARQWNGLCELYGPKSRRAVSG